MTTIDRPTILDDVDDLADTVRSHADESEAQRQLAAPVVEGVRAAGLFRGLAPRELGGREADPLIWYRTVEAAARIDGSFGWCVMINGATGLMGRTMTPDLAELLIGDPDFIVAGSAFPFGNARATDNGYTVNGHWTYASGIGHATHVFGFAVIHDGEAPRMLMPGVPALALMLTPVRNVDVLQTWDVSGLCGTGSNDFIMDNVFVEEACAISLTGPGNQYYSGPLYRVPFLTTFAFPVAAVALGIAQHSIDEMLELSQAKVPAGTTIALRERPLFHYQLSEAQALVGAARAWLHQVVGEQFQIAEDGHSPDVAQRNKTQLAASNATRSASRAVELMYLAGGGTANYRKSPLQRCMRDMHALTQHLATGPASWEGCGAIAAGLPPRNPLMML